MTAGAFPVLKDKAIRRRAKEPCSQKRDSDPGRHGLRGLTPCPKSGKWLGDGGSSNRRGVH